MILCIPTRGDHGRDDVVSDHFGSAPYFTLYNTESEELDIISNRNSQHSHGTCHPMTQLAKHHIDGVVCSSIGRRAILALREEGIAVYHSPKPQVADILDLVKADQLEEIDANKACTGRGQRYIHDHDHDHHHEDEDAPESKVTQSIETVVEPEEPVRLRQRQRDRVNSTGGRGQSRGQGQGRGAGITRGGGRNINRSRGGNRGGNR